MDTVATVLIAVGFALIVILTILFSSNQKHKVIEWLKYAVTEVEKELGRHTGQLKLYKVYGWYVDRFPIIASLVSFDTFSLWVDKALETMNKWLDSKNAISSYIREDNKNDVNNSTKE